MELKNKTVDAEALYKCVYDSKLTAEAKILIIAARLHPEGSLAREAAPKGRGFGDYDSGRQLLRQQRKADSPSNNPRILTLREECFPLLTPKEPNVKATPSPIAKPSPKPSAPARPAKSKDAPRKASDSKPSS